MTHLVCHHCLELTFVHDLQQSSRRTDDGVLRVATRRKGIGCWVVNDVDFWHRHASSDRQILNYSPQFRRIFFLNLLRASHGHG